MVSPIESWQGGCRQRDVCCIQSSTARESGGDAVDRVSRARETIERLRAIDRVDCAIRLVHLRYCSTMVDAGVGPIVACAFV